MMKLDFYSIGTILLYGPPENRWLGLVLGSMIYWLPACSENRNTRSQRLSNEQMLNIGSTKNTLKVFPPPGSELPKK